MAYGRITKKQTEILEYIKSQILNKGYPPSVRDICTAVNLKSTSFRFRRNLFRKKKSLC